MIVTVNGERRELNNGSTVEQLVESMERGRAGIAVARNGEVVPRSQWRIVACQADDLIEILTAAQGG